jgi:hypothetical protein
LPLYLQTFRNLVFRVENSTPNFPKCIFASDTSRRTYEVHISDEKYMINKTGVINFININFDFTVFTKNALRLQVFIQNAKMKINNHLSKLYFNPSLNRALENLYFRITGCVGTGTGIELRSQKNVVVSRDSNEHYVFQIDSIGF